MKPCDFKEDSEGNRCMSNGIQRARSLHDNSYTKACRITERQRQGCRQTAGEKLLQLEKVPPIREIFKN